MAILGGNFRFRQLSPAIRRWAYAARRAEATDLNRLRRQRTQARLLRSYLDRLITTADERLALPRVGSTNFPRPHNSDWAWRPSLWRGPLARPGQAAVPGKAALDREVTLFHDSPVSEVTLRQIRNLRGADLAAYGLRLDILRFKGSFLSLVVDLPEAASAGLERRHLFRLDAQIEMEQPLEIFARLNIRHGPNTEQIVQELPGGSETMQAEFDLAYSNLNEKRVERAWIEIIFERPEMNQVILRDLTLSRRPRAQF